MARRSESTSNDATRRESGRLAPRSPEPSSGRIRRWKRRAWIGALPVTVLGISLAIGCTTIIEPPAEPIDPTSVYVIDFGYHSALVLPRDEGRYVRYVYGDWSYFALEKTGTWRGFLALSAPTQGALGRDDFTAHDPQRIRGRMFRPATVEELIVPRDAVRRLLARLDGLYESSLETHVRSDTHGLDFVKISPRYCLYRNCNTALIAWLDELGCRTRGTGLYARFIVR